MIKKTNDKIKIRIILPSFYENRPIVGFTKKTDLTYFFLCTVINNDRRLLPELLLKKDKFMSNIKISSDDIRKIIQNLDSKKAQLMIE